MKIPRFVYGLVIFLVTLPFSGCIIHIGPGDGNGGPADDTPSALPEPKDPQGDEPVLDEVQQARKKEAERYVADVVYQKSTIARAIQLPSGDIVDGIDRDTLPTIPPRRFRCCPGRRRT